MIVVGVNKQGCICEWNAEAEAISGYLRREVLGLSFLDDLLTLDVQDFVAEAICYAWMGQAHDDLKIPFYTKSGIRVELVFTFAVTWNSTTKDYDMMLNGQPAVTANGSDQLVGEEGVMQAKSATQDEQMKRQLERFHMQKHMVGLEMAATEQPGLAQAAFPPPAPKAPQEAQAARPGGSAAAGSAAAPHPAPMASPEAQANVAGKTAAVRRDKEIYLSTSSADEEAEEANVTGKTATVGRDKAIYLSTSSGDEEAEEADKTDSTIRISLDKDGYVCEWSRAAEAMSGFDRAEVIGLHFADELLDPEGKDVVVESICYAWMGQLVRDVRVPFWTKSGRQTELFLTTTVQWNEAKRRHDVVFTGGPDGGSALSPSAHISARSDVKKSFKAQVGRNCADDGVLRVLAERSDEEDSTKDARPKRAPWWKRSSTEDILPSFAMSRDKRCGMLTGSQDTLSTMCTGFTPEERQISTVDTLPSFFDSEGYHLL
mmetsp:Transcript_129233/g.359878  ORF Transcript_129233/g.359878 Transcript_129233/m.359878 type:complete len:487 (+) Transcript_129233:72-1532(+)